MSNALGNETSESMREMCGCVSFSVLAKPQVYAPQGCWNVHELKETARPTNPFVPFSFCLYFFSLSFSPLNGDYALSFSLSMSESPEARSFEQ